MKVCCIHSLSRPLICKNRVPKFSYLLTHLCPYGSRQSWVLNPNKLLPFLSPAAGFPFLWLRNRADSFKERKCMRPKNLKIWLERWFFSTGAHTWVYYFKSFAYAKLWDFSLITKEKLVLTQNTATYAWNAQKVENCHAWVKQQNQVTENVSAKSNFPCSTSHYLRKHERILQRDLKKSKWKLKIIEFLGLISFTYWFWAFWN